MPVLYGGARAGPRGDSGGPREPMRMVESLRDPCHPEHREVASWPGSRYDPGRFDGWMAGSHLALAAAWGAV